MKYKIIVTEWQKRCFLHSRGTLPNLLFRAPWAMHMSGDLKTLSPSWPHCFLGHWWLLLLVPGTGELDWDLEILFLHFPNIGVKILLPCLDEHNVEMLLPFPTEQTVALLLPFQTLQKKNRVLVNNLKTISRQNWNNSGQVCHLYLFWWK